MTEMQGRSIAVFCASENGHRRSVLSQFGQLFPCLRLSRPLALIRSEKPVLFLMIEEAFGLYVWVCLVRALIGRRTAGLLLRPLPALAAQTPRTFSKYLALRLLRRVKHVSTLAILPFAIEPGIAAIADDWIDDPQLWDLGEQEWNWFRSARSHENGPIALAIRRLAAGRRALCAIGRQDKAKGFDQFADLYADEYRLRDVMLFASGGKIAPDMAGKAAAFTEAGGYALPAELSDHQLVQFYAASDLVWCAYAAEYDQASGILGRAVQFGIPVIVRDGSLIHRQCLVEGLAHSAVGPENAAERLLANTPLPRQSWAPDAETRRQRSLARLCNALGIDR